MLKDDVRALTTDTRMTTRLLVLGWLAERYWDEMKESLNPEVRHTLGGEVAKVRLLRTIQEREETPRNGHA